MNAAPPTPTPSHSAARWLILIVLFCAIALLAATLGAPVPLSDLWARDAARLETARTIFFELRPPRILAGVLVGASLATSGAALQAVFRNPLAEPYLLGVSSGGALGAAIAMWLQLPSLGHVAAVSLLAFAGSLGASLAVYYLGQSLTPKYFFGASQGAGRATLLLIGVAMSALLSALMSLVVALGNRIELAQQITFWLLGGLAAATMTQNAILAVALLLGLALLLLSARDLNALQIGDEEAASLGVAVETVHRRLLLGAALMSAAAVSTAGLIGFIGLLAPHVMRLLFGSDARALVPASAIGGAMLLTACDAIARSAAAPVEIPVGIITALLGVPLFLFLMRRS